MTWKHVVGIFGWWGLVALAACEPATLTVPVLFWAAIGFSLTYPIWPTVDELTKRGVAAVLEHVHTE